MKKIIKSLALFLLTLNLVLTIQMAVVYAEVAPTPGTTPTPLDTILQVGSDTQLPSFFGSGQHPDAPPDYLQPGVGTLTSPAFFALDLFRYAMSAIAILVVIAQAIKLVARSEDEEAQKAKRVLLYGIIGLLVIQVADYAVKNIFFGEQGDTFESLTKAQTDAETGVAFFRSIAGLINIFLGTFAVLVIVIRGFTVMVSAGNEEAISKARRHILYAVVGLVAVGLSELIVKGFIFPEKGEVLPNINTGKKIIVMLTNYVASFIVIFTFIALTYIGYRYVVSAGNEEVTEKTKKAFFGAIVALLLSMGAFAIVNTVIKLEPGADASPGLVEETDTTVEIIN